jgi:hypothetical protein
MTVVKSSLMGAIGGAAVMVDCLGLSLPHGLAFIDDQRVVVANRAGELVLVDLPPGDCDMACMTVEKRVIANASSAVPVLTPGSVTAIDERLPRALALLAPPDGLELQLLCVDGDIVFATELHLTRIDAIAAETVWYPYGAGSFGSEMAVF